MDNETLASEIIHEVKASSRRWFIISIIELVLWISTIGGFLWYISLPVEVASENYSQAVDGGNDNSLIGGDYYSGETNDPKNASTQSN